jgi:hypothetical protein
VRGWLFIGGRFRRLRGCAHVDQTGSA